MAAIQSGVPWTTDATDDQTAALAERNEASADAAVFDPSYGPDLADLRAELDDTYAAAASLAPVRVAKSDANLPVTTVAGTWTDLDTGGTAAARPLDVVIPGVKVGQWVEVEPNATSAAATTNVSLDICTIVAGVPVHHFGDPALIGVTAWFCPSGALKHITGAVWYQVQADDIENGSVRLRMRARNSSTTARAINATGGNIFTLVGRGPF